MSTVPYNVLQLMDKIIKTKGKGGGSEDLQYLMDTTYAYGRGKRQYKLQQLCKKKIIFMVEQMNLIIIE